MPTYDYACPKCERRFEVFHSMSDDTPRRCPKCKVKARRVPSGGAGLLFKGSGFYITDYRSDNYKKGASEDKGGDTGGKKDAGSSGKSGESGSGGKSGESGSGGKSGESRSGGKSGGSTSKD
jgi:putative FmdB family regulatory protein